MRRKPIRQPYFSQEHHSWVIPLTQGVIALVDEDVARTLGDQNWYANRLGSDRWYAVSGAGAPDWNQKLLMHIAILGPRDGLEVDHAIHYPIEMRRIDNRRANLRHATRLENASNQRRKVNASSPYKGVTWDASRGKWMAGIMHNYRRINIGRFDDPRLAAMAYDERALSLHGRFALTNAALGLL